MNNLDVDTYDGHKDCATGRLSNGDMRGVGFTNLFIPVMMTCIHVA